MKYLSKENRFNVQAVNPCFPIPLPFPPPPLSFAISPFNS